MEYSYKNLPELVKPEMSMFGLTKAELETLSKVKEIYNKREAKYLFSAFIFSCITILIIILILPISKYYIFTTPFAAAIFSWIIVPNLFEFLFHYDIKTYLFEKNSADLFKETKSKLEKFNRSKQEYLESFSQREQLICKSIWNGWLKLDKHEFENELKLFYQSKGFKINTNKTTIQDSFIIEEGAKKILVLYKHKVEQIGVSYLNKIITQLLGLVSDFDEIFIFSLKGFKLEATDKYQNSKFKFYDIDYLAKEEYNFENYIHYHFSTSETLDELIKAINNNLVSNRKYRLRVKNFK
ncbi:MAG: hypothetical protein LCH37_13490 [Bacteroidetes bacterium]|nr:hypothetical protein [Bacteroidota bacterium]